VVLIGGSWDHGFGDRQDTFLGEVDGAVVHAAWVLSWLKPLKTNKLIDMLLNALIIESLLHPVMRFTVAGLRRKSDEYTGFVSDRDSGEARVGLGRHVVGMLGYLGAALIVFSGIALSMILADGLLRWALDWSLALDTTILALLLWSIAQYHGAGARAAGAQPARKNNDLATSWARFLAHSKGFWLSVRRSMAFARRPRPSTKRGWSNRLIEAAGAAFWVGLWILGAYLFVRPALHVAG
jgi:hypothetical protein